MTVEDVARAIVWRRQTAEHEAGHASAAILLGWPVREVRVEEDREQRRSGVVVLAPLEADVDAARRVALIVLAGPLAAGSPRWPPCFPFSPVLVADDHLAGDETLLRELVTALRLDKAGYRQLITDAYNLICRKDFTRLEYAITAAFQYTDHLDASVIHELVQIAIQNEETTHVA